ncbi:MAG: hypothetical protein CMI02_09965 [Oceanospirillaceae bacterium]|nr:hypothetical protein [Oceanospirillaceae bacterium]MBT12347.1 hypothetical protein [Oceanospirillaceae bacterium]|tara:strand:- start:34089 stop:34325 length:237 start_codon:yes stop_codon:yes gene_type:complete
MQDRPHHKHAEKVVQQFREELGEDLCKKIGDYPFGSLSVLIESAINTSVMKAVDDTIHDFEEALARSRKRARGVHQSP